MKRINDTVCLFGRFNLIISRALKYYQDCVSGKRTLFITDRAESFVISFEEGVQMPDIFQAKSDLLHFQAHKDGNHICQQRRPHSNCAFFCMQIGGAELFGQMTAESRYRWSDGVEPILLELLDGVSNAAEGLQQ